MIDRCYLINRDFSLLYVAFKACYFRSASPRERSKQADKPADKQHFPLPRYENHPTSIQVAAVFCRCHRWAFLPLFFILFQCVHTPQKFFVILRVNRPSIPQLFRPHFHFYAIISRSSSKASIGTITLANLA